MASHKDKANNKPARNMGKRTKTQKYSGICKQTNDKVIIAMLERRIKMAQKLEKENTAMLRVVRKHYKMKKKERAASQATKKLDRNHSPAILQRNQQELTASPELVMNTTDLISEATGPAPKESFPSETQSLQSGTDDSATVSEDDHKGGSEALARDDAYDDNEEDDREYNDSSAEGIEQEFLYSIPPYIQVQGDDADTERKIAGTNNDEDDTSSLRDYRLKYYAFGTQCSNDVLSRVTTALMEAHRLTVKPSNALLSEIRSFGQTVDKNHPNRLFLAPPYLAFRKLHTLNTARTEERRPTTFK